MPLTQEQENLEHELRVKTMQLGIEQTRADIEQMRASINRIQPTPDTLRSETRSDARKFAAQFLALMAVALGAGYALGTWVITRTAPPPVVQSAPPQATPSG